MTPKKRGGKRQGAGRKKSPVKRVGFSVWILPEAKARIQARADREGVKPAALVEAWASKSLAGN
jgi:hypothetical protein